MITFNVTFSSSNVQMDTNFGTLQRLTKKGLDGLSAYEIAVKNGFVGSEEEWLKSLQGATGLSSTTEGFFTLAVEKDGNLYAYVEDDSELEFEYDEQTGSLYIVQEVE